MKKLSIALLSIIMMIVSTSCDDNFLEHNPSSKLSSGTVLKSESAAQAALNGVYYLMYEPGDGNTCSLYQMGYPFVNELRAEDVISQEQPWWVIFKNVYLYNTDMSDDLSWYLWAQSYKTIDACNLIINGDLSALPSAEKKKDFIAQAKVIRAMVYLDLVGVFCKPYYKTLTDPNVVGVPLMLTGDHKTYQDRGKLVDVYTQIEKDLTEALPDLLLENEPTRMSKLFANGLLARLYLNKREYSKAYDKASIVVAGSTLMDAEELRKGLSGIPTEAVFTFTNTDKNYAEYRTFTTYWEGDDSMGKDIRVPIEVANKFADNDIRKTFFWNRANWLGVNTNFASNTGFTGKTAFESSKYDIATGTTIDRCYMYGKFPRVDFTTSDLSAFLAPYADYTKENVEARAALIKTEGTLGLGNYTYMRASEMVLVKAECAARIGGKDSEAQDELFKIQSRAITGAMKSTNTGTALIDEILLEKRKELLGEGHRMKDALRLGQTINRYASSWGDKRVINVDTDPKVLLPIPSSEIKANPLLENSDQNESY